MAREMMLCPGCHHLSDHAGYQEAKIAFADYVPGGYAWGDDDYREDDDNGYYCPCCGEKVADTENEVNDLFKSFTNEEWYDRGEE